MILNEKNNKTKKVIHLLVTSLCDRNCKYCCNKQYDLNDIPQVTEEELSECETVCITGGEPFAYSKPFAIAHNLKTKYPNIKKVYVYTNAYEMYSCILNLPQSLNSNGNSLIGISFIDGYNISLKSSKDILAFRRFVNLPPYRRDYSALNNNLMSILNNIYFSVNKTPLHNRLYIQTQVDDEIINKIKEYGFEVIERPWQKEFVPCDDSIFRRI